MKLNFIEINKARKKFFKICLNLNNIKFKRINF